MSTQVLVERSHVECFPKLAGAYRSRVEARDGDDFFSIPQSAVRDGLLEADGHVVVHLEAGDLLCWDSRTVHCSWPGGALADEPDAPKRPRDSRDDDSLPRDRLARAALYVSFTPRCLVSPKVAAERLAAVEAGVTTTHWASVCRTRPLYPTDLSEYERARYRCPPRQPLADDARRLL